MFNAASCTDNGPSRDVEYSFAMSHLLYWSVLEEGGNIVVIFPKVNTHSCEKSKKCVAARELQEANHSSSSPYQPNSSPHPHPVQSDLAPTFISYPLAFFSVSQPPLPPQPHLRSVLLPRIILASKWHRNYSHRLNYDRNL